MSQEKKASCVPDLEMVSEGSAAVGEIFVVSFMCCFCAFACCFRKCPRELVLKGNWKVSTEKGLDING